MERARPRKDKGRFQHIKIITKLTTVLTEMIKDHNLRATVSNQVRVTLFSSIQGVASITLMEVASLRSKQLCQNTVVITLLCKDRTIKSKFHNYLLYPKLIT